MGCLTWVCTVVRLEWERLMTGEGCCVLFAGVRGCMPQRFAQSWFYITYEPHTNMLMRIKVRDMAVTKHNVTHIRYHHIWPLYVHKMIEMIHNHY